MAKRKSLLDIVGEALGIEEQNQVVGEKPEPVTKKVSLIIHNPRIPSADNQRLNKALGWHDPRKLAKEYIADLHECSYGYVNYKIVEEIEVDRFPRKADGFVYQADEFYNAWKSRKGFHDLDAVDYDALLEEFDMLKKVDSGKIDEFWLYAFPYAGYYESIMGGPGAFWCNAPALTQTAHASKRFIIMGFNYQRGVGEALEAFGHRAESIMKYTFRNKKGNRNLWERFWRHEKENPGQAEVGWMHYAPNSERDYDWGNKRLVMSRWKTWQNFPNLEGDAIMCNCSDWGDGDIREHHKWWFKLLPHVTGSDDGISYNWWRYIIDPNLVR
ncbi:MAG: hypothetical protein R3C44_17850 [Chloroflexota bacterium]